VTSKEEHNDSACLHVQSETELYSLFYSSTQLSEFICSVVSLQFQLKDKYNRCCWTSA